MRAEMNTTTECEQKVESKYKTECKHKAYALQAVQSENKSQNGECKQMQSEKSRMPYKSRSAESFEQIATRNHKMDQLCCQRLLTDDEISHCTLAVKRCALELAEAAVGLERLGKLDHARHVPAVVGEVVVGETAHESQPESVSGY